MAAVAVFNAMNGNTALHPFFAKTKPQNDPNEHHDSNGSASGDEINLVGSGDQVDGSHEAKAKPKENGTRRKIRASAQGPHKNQKTLQEVVNPKAITARAQTECDGQEIPNSCSSDPAFSSPRRKRRRTSHVESVEVGDQDDDTGNGQVSGKHTTPRKQASPQVIVLASSPLPVAASEYGAGAQRTPPKKMLKLNASGKFSSPISKSLEQDAPAETVKRRGRPRKSKDAEEIKELVVRLKYNNAAGFGHRLERILLGEERFHREVHVTPKKQRTPTKERLSKSAHPFFQPKPKEPLAKPKQESPRKASAVTPGKLRRQTLNDRSPAKQPTRPTQDYVVGSDLLKDRLMFKHPGAKEAAWPTRDQTHVRGLSSEYKSNRAQTAEVQVSYRKRKRKTANVPFPAEKSLLHVIGRRLQPEEGGQLRSDGYREPHQSIAIPQKLLIPGQEIASRVATELSVSMVDDTEDELVRPESSQLSVHPALRKLHNSLDKCVTSFDESRGETLSWTQKYEPSTAGEVLQPLREMNVLKAWLASLTVNAVVNMPKAEPKTASNCVPKSRKKRRRKNDDLDDFLVDDDEDIREMDELTDPEDIPSIPNDGRKSARSVVEVAGDGIKLSNAVLLSGPNGCGKTAAAYAVAKELGFKVFEISSCERRSGKDVQDKIGNMTENHLVKHHGADVGDLSSTEEPSQLDQAFQRDLASGRQGKMFAFFKPQTKANLVAPKKKKSPKKSKISVLEAVQQAIKKPQKDQQQSLILLEEVDILFKDDKDFWNTVLKLIASSKRPFIMTCNDEDLIPLHLMSLHAILRFTPPSVDLVADYLLLIAAAEGHLIKRDAVLSLYQSKGRDLRAAIAELDLWCQMGVGDPRGGLSWIYQRYPPGSDLDQHGRKLRVVSDGTYRNGMGMSINSNLDDDTQLLWAQYEYDTEPASCLGWHDMVPVHGEHQHSLKAYLSFADALSAADVYCRASNITKLDTTQPELVDKARSHYIEGLPLLQTDETTDYSGLTSELFVASTLAIYRVAGLVNAEDIQTKLQATIASGGQRSVEPALTRQDFACFDTISVPAEAALSTSSGLVQSAFDGPLAPITTDLAPYVRSIVHFDLALAEQREQLNSIMSQGRNAKRARTTRTARSALEGSQRASTRKERWFPKELNTAAVLATGGHEWPRRVMEVVETG